MTALVPPERDFCFDVTDFYHSTGLSSIRCWMNQPSHWWSRVSKELWSYLLSLSNQKQQKGSGDGAKSQESQGQRIGLCHIYEIPK